ncbi:hypothetical protein LIER_32423 [Lithospermum erythrorhizon]|uniref:Uncharacterized protein n=1 Tax=Lithospermum erythrorhizon TaxID=34254 RepID=A0AAV3RX95_LITER
MVNRLLYEFQCFMDDCYVCLFNSLAMWGQQSRVAMLPDSSVTCMPNESLLGDQNLLEVPNTVKCKMYLDYQSNGPKLSQEKMGNLDAYAPVSGADIEMGKIESPKSNVKVGETMKMENTNIKVLQRDFSFKIGGKIMQLLMDQSLDLPKSASRDKSTGERVCDTFTNRSRKYKRSASFNSRSVVLLFSFLSIMGTMILIYLTLRVRQLTIAAASA